MHLDLEAPVIEARGLGKKFARSLRKAMVYGLTDIARAGWLPARHRSPGLAARLRDAAAAAPAETPADEVPLRPSEFWALRDVNFEVRRGQCLGLVGHNGAGKSTLLSLVSGIYGPTTGRITVRGRLQALIALGAGFHPLLSGRENIYINAAILGLRRREIDGLLDQIIAFSELGDFVEMPVKNYSSGMLVRLGFSIAAHLDPDILLIDEVLAVGDGRFQLKCQEHTRKLVDSGRAIILVSHLMHNIQGMCDRALWLEHGQVRMAGDTHEVTGAYQDYLMSRLAAAPTAGAGGPATFPGHLRRIDILDEHGLPVEPIPSGSPIRVRLELFTSVAVPQARFYVSISHPAYPRSILTASMLEDGHAVALTAGSNCIELQFDALPLADGLYTFYANARSGDGQAAISDGLTTRPLRVAGAGVGDARGRGPLRQVDGVTQGVVTTRYRWQRNTDEQETGS